MAGGTARGARPKLRLAARVLAGVAGVVLVAVIVLAVVPSSSGGLVSRPDPAAGYAESMSRFAAVRARERRRVHEPCKSRLLQHGRRTAVAVVLVHGLTNCPRQFVELGRLIHSTGANVLILRVPHHGLADTTTRAIGGVGNVGGLTAGQLRAYADEAVDTARGLGRDVRVLGLSMGGVVSAWIAQHRDDVARAVVVAPALTLPRMPDVVDYVFVNLFGRLPDVSLPGSSALTHAYAGESTRALAEMYRLSRSVRASAAIDAPAVASIALVTNANDDQVDNGDVRALGEAWRRLGADVQEYEFPRRLGLRHDLIDVQQPDARPELVYPVLAGLLGFGG